MGAMKQVSIIQAVNCPNEHCNGVLEEECEYEGDMTLLRCHECGYLYNVDRGIIMERGK